MTALSMLVLLLVAVQASAPPDSGRSFDTGEYNITCNPSAMHSARITVVGKRDSRIVYTVVLKDIDCGHFFAPAFRVGCLYAIRRIGELTSDAWANELWLYDEKHRGTRLFADHGFTYRVAPRGEFIAIVHHLDAAELDELILLGGDGTPIRTIPARDLGMDRFDVPWVTDRFLYLPATGPEQAFDQLVKVGVRDSSMRRYAFPQLGIDADSDFNPRTEMVIGSDCPMFQDAEDYEAWQKSKPVVTLRLYSLPTGKETVIATSTAASFDPRWVSDVAFEYTGPASGKRVTRSVGSRSDKPR